MERRAFLRASVASVGGAGALAASAPSAAASVASAENPLRVQVLVFDGVEEQDFVAPVEVLVVPGGGPNDKTGPGVNRLIGGQGSLRRLAAADVLPAGVLVLSAAGIIKGRNATPARRPTSPPGRNHGRRPCRGRRGPDPRRAKLTQRVETVLEYERRGTVWRA